MSGWRQIHADAMKTPTNSTLSFRADIENNEVNNNDLQHL